MKNLEINSIKNQHYPIGRKDKNIIEVQIKKQSQKFNKENQDHQNYHLSEKQSKVKKIQQSTTFNSEKTSGLRQKNIINEQNFRHLNKKKQIDDDKSLQMDCKKDLHFIQKTTIAFKQRFRNKYNKINKIGQIIKVSNSISVSLTPRTTNKDLKFNKKRLNTINSGTPQVEGRIQSISFRKNYKLNNENEKQSSVCQTNQIYHNLKQKKAKSLQTSKVNLKSNRSVQDKKNHLFGLNQYSCDKMNIKDKQDYFSIKEEDNEETITKNNQRRTLTPVSKYFNYSKNLYDLKRQKWENQFKISQKENKSLRKSYIFFDEQQKRIEQKQRQQYQQQFRQLQNQQTLLQEQIKQLNRRQLKEVQQNNVNRKVTGSQNDKNNKIETKSSQQLNYKGEQIVQKQENSSENENILPLSVKLNEQEKLSNLNFNCKQHFSKKMIKRLQIIRKQRQIKNNDKQKPLTSILPRIKIKLANQQRQTSTQIQRQHQQQKQKQPQKQNNNKKQRAKSIR